MSKQKKFKCESGLEDYLTVYEENGEILVHIANRESNMMYVCLEKKGALRLAERLLKEINKI